MVKNYICHLRCTKNLILKEMEVWSVVGQKADMTAKFSFLGRMCSASQGQRGTHPKKMISKQYLDD